MSTFSKDSDGDDDTCNSYNKKDSGLNRNKNRDILRDRLIHKKFVHRRTSSILAHKSIEQPGKYTSHTKSRFHFATKF